MVVASENSAAPASTDNAPLSPPADAPEADTPHTFSPVRRYTLLVVFCVAQFVDAFNNSALFSAM
jgi:hypothetical protein